MADIYILRAKVSPVFGDMYRILHRIWAPWPPLSSFEFKGNILQNWWKPKSLPISGFFRVKMLPKIGSWRTCLRTPESESNSCIPATKCHDHGVKLFEKWPKTFFYLFEFRPFVGEKLPKTITQWAIIYTQVKYTRYTWKPSLMVTQ